MVDQAITGLGAQFRRWNSDTNAWDTISSINNITGPSKSRKTIDTTCLDTEGGYNTFIAAFRNPGTVVLAMNYTRDGYELMNDDFESDDLQDYEIVLPDVDHTSLVFQGLVTELPLTIPPEDKLTMNVTIQISGPVTLGSGGSESPV